MLDGKTNINFKETKKTPNFGAIDAKVLKHQKVCERLNAIYNKKNHDYGDSFSRTFQDWGIACAGIRIEDKLNRFKSLIKNEALVEDETLADTLIDMANYCIMTYMELVDEVEEETVR